MDKVSWWEEGKEEAGRSEVPLLSETSQGVGRAQI